MQNVYESNRLLYKVLNKNYASPVLSFYEDNKSNFEPWEPKREDNFYTLPYQRASLIVENNLITEGKLLRLWAFLKDNPDEIVGCVCFQNILREPYRSCSLGYKISYKYLHQGYAYEALNKCIDILFAEYPIHRIEAYIMENNEPSMRLIERLSFHYEGLSYDYARIRGIWTNHRRYSLINPRTM